MLARLADIAEFAQLRRHFMAEREEDVKALARRSYAHPEQHDRAEWEKLRAFHAGVDAVLGLPEKMKARTHTERKESR